MGHKLVATMNTTDGNFEPFTYESVDLGYVLSLAGQIQKNSNRNGPNGLNGSKLAQSIFKTFFIPKLRF